MATVEFECVKQICKAIRKTHKIASKSYGYCCWSDYFRCEPYPDTYIVAKIFKGGLNNNYNGGYWDLGKTVYFAWSEDLMPILSEICATMQKVADNWGYKIEMPENESKCIELIA